MGTVSDLRHAAEWVAEAANQGMKTEWMAPYRQLRAAAVDVGRAWCGSWLPQFSAFYDRDLVALPLHLRVQAAATPDRLPPALTLSCRLWTAQQIEEAIHSQAGNPDDAGLRQGALAATAMLDDAVVAAVAALECAVGERPADHRLAGQLLAVRQIETTDAAIFVERCRPMSAQLQGATTAAAPPHIAELARLEALRSPFEALRQFAWLMRSVAAHLEHRTAGALPATPQRAWLRPSASGRSAEYRARHLPRVAADPVREGVTADETIGER